LLGLAVLAYVIWSHWEPKPGSTDRGLKDVLSQPIQFRPWLIAGLFTTCAVILTFIRWSILTRALNLPLSFHDTMRLGCIGYFFNTMLPGSIGGDLVKAGSPIRSQERRTAAVATILCDRLIGLIGLIALVVVMGSIFWLLGDPMISESGLRWVFRACAILLGLSAIVWVFMGFLTDRRVHRFAGRLSLIPKVGGVLSELWRSVWLYRKKPGIVYLTLAMTMGLHVFNVLAFHFAVRVFTSNSAEWATLREHFILVPIGLVVRALFPAPGGAGGAEFGFGKLYQLAGRPETVGILGSLALLVLAWVLGACAYGVGMAMRPTMAPPETPTEPTPPELRS